MATSTVPLGSSERWTDKKRYLWLIGLVVPSLAFVGFGMWSLTGWGVWFWIGPIVILVIVPAIDLIAGLDRSNPTDDVIEAWIGESPTAWRYLPNLNVELVQVSIFLAAFSGLYLTVSTVTDETYRAQFFSRVEHQLERAVGVRAAYLALRERESISDPAPS